MPSQIIDAALRLDAGALPAFAGVDLGPQGYAVVKVLKVLPREVASEATARQDRAQYVQWWTAAETMAYYNLLKEQVKAQIKVPKPVAAARDDASVQNR